MKRFALVLAMLVALSAAAFADHPNKLGLGVVGSGGYGNIGSGGDIGLALKVPSVPIFWALHLSMSSNGIGFGATGDVYFIDQRLLTEGDFALDWYFGVGGYASLGIWSSTTHVALGARLPIGLSWHITPEFELWCGAAPQLGIRVAPELQFPDWNVAGELGLRYWFK